METRLIMLGAAPGTRSTIACVVEAYRVHGLFRRWPIEYVERQVERILPSGADGLLGVHTVNRAGDLTVIDGFARRPRF